MKIVFQNKIKYKECCKTIQTSHIIKIGLKKDM